MHDTDLDKVIFFLKEDMAGGYRSMHYTCNQSNTSQQS